MDSAPHSCAAEDSFTGMGVAGSPCATAELRRTVLEPTIAAHNTEFFIMVFPFACSYRSPMVAASTSERE
jgi:hypothetical protein